MVKTLALLLVAIPLHAGLVEDALRVAGMDAGTKQKVLDGEIVSKELAEGSDKELAASLVVLIRAPLAKTFAAIRDHKTLEANRDILSFGNDLGKLGYAPEEADEAAAFLNATPGSKFNLSATEFDRVRALKARLKGVPDLAAINAEYRAFLTDRLAAYQKGGVAAIAAYSRGKKQSSPAEELRLAMKEALVGKIFPEFFEAVEKYPAPAKEVEHEYLWFKQRIEKRPVFILAHRMYAQDGDHALMVERQIYVGASYNSSQTIAGGVADGDRVIALYGNRCFTDQVAGSMSGMKHSIGRGQMIGELKTLFESVRKTLEK